MNAFQPKVSLLDKLGQIVVILEDMVRAETWLYNGLKDLVLNSEVREWMARMRELERLPPMEGDLQVVDGKFVLLPQPAREPVFNIGPPTPEMIADAGPPNDYVDRMLENMIAVPALVAGFNDGVKHSPYISTGPLVGYTLSAKHPDEGFIVTYAEARNVQEAAERCYDEFPQSENYSTHSVKNNETGVETMLPEIPDLVPESLFSAVNQQSQAQRVAEYIVRKETETDGPLSFEEDVVDTGLTALSLDDD